MCACNKAANANAAKCGLAWPGPTRHLSNWPASALVELAWSGGCALLWFCLGSPRLGLAWLVLYIALVVVVGVALAVSVFVAQVIFYDQFRQVERLLIGQPLAVDDRSTSGVIKARDRASPRSCYTR